jgi:translocator protein
MMRLDASPKRSPAGLWIGLGVVFVAVAGSALTDIGPWYKALKQPFWKPPDWAFGPIWTTIFVLTGIAATRVVNRSRRAEGRGLFSQTQASIWPPGFTLALVVNGVLNIAWSFFYFYLKRPDWAMVEWFFLWASVWLLVFLAFQRDRLAAALLLPYGVWVTVAGALNWSTIQLNPSVLVGH